MKYFIAVALLAVAVSANLSDNLEWTSFKLKHARKYALLEEKLRFPIFQKNLRKIEEHNAKYEKGESSYFLKVTRFADWTEQELKTFFGYQTVGKPTNSKVFKSNAKTARPDSLDWRDRGAVLEVKNQGNCGSCWAFSTTGGLEAQIVINFNVSYSLSEQELMDCSYDYGNRGCDGGNMIFGYNYVAEEGIASEETYPYTAKQGECKNIPTEQKILGSTNGYIWIEENTEDALADAVVEGGPVSVAVEANDNWKLYGGGVFDDAGCGDAVNHGVLVVGYDKDSWIIKNSWGPEWGEKGFIRLVRGKSQCGITQEMLYPDFTNVGPQD